MSSVAIELKNVSKKYFVHHEKPTLMENLFSKKNEEFYALKNINLTINKGDRVGIIGINGSGKTTLLKLMAGITTPTSGYVRTCGKIVSLIDLEAGFHPDLTGLQNIYLNGAILGMNKNDIDNKIDRIIDFADIGNFIDAQLYTYSSGMQLRLGFSIAIHAEPDVLLLDENIAVGDQDFQQKSYDKFKELVKNKKTFLLVSHRIDLIRQLTDRTILLKNSKIDQFGPSSKVIKKYLSSYDVK